MSDQEDQSDSCVVAKVKEGADPYLSKMKKTDFVAALARRTNRSQSDVATLINEMLNEIVDQNMNGRSVEFWGFGLFTPSWRKPQRVNCRPDLPMVAGRYQPTFRPAPAYRKALAEGALTLTRRTDEDSGNERPVLKRHINPRRKGA